jgi:hypothetical protein
VSARTLGAARALIGELTREVDDFPEPGVQFKDLTPVLADRRGLAAVTAALAEVAADADLIAGIDARGFLLGAAVATRLDVGMLAVRKGGKLPPPVLRQEYLLEYGSAVLEIPAAGLDHRRRAGHRRHRGGRRGTADRGGCGRRRGGGGAGTGRAGRTRPGRTIAGHQP